MFKFIAVYACLVVASAAPGFIAGHQTLIQPAVVDTSASSAITHQSFTNLEKKVPVAPVVHTYAAAAPAVVNTVAAPVVHTYAAAPVVKTVATPGVHTYATVVQNYAAAPLVHASTPVIHSAPLVKTVVSAPVAYTTYH